MAYAMCPICGALSHLNVSDEETWQREKHPDVPVGDVVPEPCRACFAPIAVGDQVVSRKMVNQNVSFEPDQRGRVSQLYANDQFGNLYVVQLESGKTQTYPRAAIRKLTDGEC